MLYMKWAVTQFNRISCGGISCLTMDHYFDRWNISIFMENRCGSLWEMKQFNLFVCITFGNYGHVSHRHVWILKYIATLHMEPVVSHCVEKQKICLWAHQKVQRMKASTLSFLWSDFGVKVMLFKLCPKIHEHRIFVFRTWWIGIAWNNLILLAILNLKLLPDLKKN